MLHRSRRRRGAPRGHALLRRADVATLVGFLVLIPLTAVASKVALEHQKRELWRPHAPLCPTAKAMLKNSPIDPPRTLAFEGLTITRLGGDAECTVIVSGEPFAPRDHAVCQFDNPIMLKAAAQGVSRIFMVGIGRPARVALEDGRPVCWVDG